MIYSIASAVVWGGKETNPLIKIVGFINRSHPKIIGHLLTRPVWSIFECKVNISGSQTFSLLRKIYEKQSMLAPT